MSLTHLSDEALVASLASVCADERRLLARLIQHLVEVEDRRLHLKAACSSMFDFCVRRLGMSEGGAFRRINAARLVRRFPGLLGTIERGELHLSSLVLLRDHLTEANVEELVASTRGRSKRELEELLARRAPRPDVPSTLRRLPQPQPPQVTATAPLPPGSPSPVVAATPLPVPEAPPARARIEPLADARYKLQLTASTALRDKLERARDLMRHRNPAGDLAVVVERALDALLDQLEKERLGKTARPPSTPPARATRAGRVARAVRRAVFERDGEQCTFTDATGARCPSRTLLELDHVESRALGGSGEASNLRVRCRAHNALHAEEVFGRAHVAAHIDLRQRKRHGEAPVPVPAEPTPTLWPNAPQVEYTGAREAATLTGRQAGPAGRAEGGRAVR
jgi:hypothetical protein